MKEPVHVTGYAFETIAGNEANFRLDCLSGFTDPQESRWASFIDRRSIDSVREAICAVAGRALRMAGLPARGVRMALVLASNFYELAFWEEGALGAYRQGEAVPEALMERYSIGGPVLCTSAACASGGSAVISACQLLHDGRADAALVVGYDVRARSPENGMRTLGALSKNRIAPFSARRSGTDLADGIGVAVLERPGRAKALAGIIGYGMREDAYNPTSPDPTGDALEQAIQASLHMAGAEPHSIQYINAHGSGTAVNDELETRVIKRVFGAHAKRLLINSSKSIIGHTLGAAGLIEMDLTILQMQRGQVHPTANFKGPDPDCDLHYCFTHPVRHSIRRALTTSIGFGGLNVCLLVENGAAA